MKSIKAIAFIFALALSVAPAAFAQKNSPVAGSPIVAKLVVPDTKLLPGVPFEMWIELQNTSSAHVGVGLCADLLVRSLGQDLVTISGNDDTRRYPVLLPEERHGGKAVSYLELKPNGKQTLTLPILHELSGPLFFDDDRVSEPGHYQVSVRLDYCWGDVVPQKSVLPTTFLGPVVTDEVTIERITPTGGDAVVWQRMQELSGGNWIPISWVSTEAGRTVMNEILTKHTDSNYYPYALLASSFGGVTDAHLNRQLDAIKRFPASPVIEMLELEAFGTAISARKHAQYEERLGRVQKSKRPTTRILAFGREDVDPPCPANYVCEN